MPGATDRTGPNWERKVADYAAARGLPWDKGPPRGTRDLLDITGCLPAGWLIGCKAIHRDTPDTPKGRRLSDAMAQCQRALLNLPPGSRGEVFPVQVLQRSSYPPGRAYVVTEFDWFLDWVQLRAKLEAGR